ncbi:uncharacterized protein LOC143858749 [Tasmannia lanceolata]|uniref:uncharacterized protein LOC143847830 n=1 Tax=Tasmannia lanceolata TaxID=3420 RepID=UPI004062ECD6
MASSEATEGPVLNLMNKRLRALKKKYNRILQMEENMSQGKPLNKEQEEVLRSKPSVSILIEEYEKLRQPLSLALQEELSLSHQNPNPSKNSANIKSEDPPTKTSDSVEDLLNLLYFGYLFDVKPQSEFTSTMLTRTHERECCLTYDYVTDEATVILAETDLDFISMLGGLVMARPVHSSLSHKNALRSCVQHAKLWLENSDHPIQPGAAVTYAGLRERLNKILASDYFTTTPEMKAPVDVAAAAGKYASSQVSVQESSTVTDLGIQTEGALAAEYQQKVEEVADFKGKDTVVDQSNSVEGLTKDELDTLDPAGDVISAQQEDLSEPQPDMEEQNEVGNAETKEQQHVPRKTYQNQRGGARGGGRRGGYPNSRGGRGSRGGGNYQNGRSQYYEPGNYYPRNYYNANYARGGGGGRHAGPTTMLYINDHGGDAPAEVESSGS